MHAGVLRSGVLRLGTEVVCLVDSEKRMKLAANHTTTHVMNFALREVLKRDTDQKGVFVFCVSRLIDDDGNRFAGVLGKTPLRL